MVGIHLEGQDELFASAYTLLRLAIHWLSVGVSVGECCV